MNDLKGTAVRKAGRITITLTGYLQSSCFAAAIRDFYPGGNIQYLVDPGAAQVFVDEARKPNVQECSFALLPWTDTVVIPDKAHKSVQVFLNEKQTLTLTVQDADKGSGKYIVIALTGVGEGKHLGCSVLPEGSLFPAIYSQVFGPASRAECEQYVSANCGVRGGDPAGPLSVPASADAAAAAASDTAGVVAGAVTGLPLGRVTSVVAIRYGADLLIHVSGLTYGFGGRLIVERSPLDIFPPIFIVRESPCIVGNKQKAAPTTKPTVAAFAFPGAGSPEVVTIVDAAGHQGISVVEAVKADGAPAGDSAALGSGAGTGGAAAIQASKWTAVHNYQPTDPPHLTVRGVVTFPKPGFRLKLTPAVPQGINPQILLLNLSIMLPVEPLPGGPTDVEVSYVEQTAYPYTDVQINPLGEDVKVENVFCRAPGKLPAEPGRGHPCGLRQGSAGSSFPPPTSKRQDHPLIYGDQAAGTGTPADGGEWMSGTLTGLPNSMAGSRRRGR